MSSLAVNGATTTTDTSKHEQYTMSYSLKDTLALVAYVSEEEVPSLTDAAVAAGGEWHGWIYCRSADYACGNWYCPSISAARLQQLQRPSLHLRLHRYNAQGSVVLQPFMAVARETR